MERRLVVCALAKRQARPAPSASQKSWLPALSCDPIASFLTPLLHLSVREHAAHPLSAPAPTPAPAPPNRPSPSKRKRAVTLGATVLGRFRSRCDNVTWSHPVSVAVAAKNLGRLVRLAVFFFVAYFPIVVEPATHPPTHTHPTLLRAHPPPPPR